MKQLLFLLATITTLLYSCTPDNPNPNGPTTDITSVTIGSQVWSSKNLDINRYRNGDPIPQVTDRAQWLNLTFGAWCWYNNDSATYAATYGRLYNWYAITDPRGLAPQGWRIPTEKDWNILINNLDPNSDTSCIDCDQSVSAGGKMKSLTGWSPPNSGNNSSGFNGLPGGYRIPSFEGVGLYGIWWSSDESEPGFSYGRALNYLNTSIFRRSYFQSIGLSVRLVKN
jgi:uncharacterized protein (TIGR02145 family)